MLGIRMKQQLKSRVFWGTVILFAAIMLAGVYEDLPHAKANSSSVLYLYLVTSSIGITTVLIPVITIVPFAFYYVEELEKKAAYYNLIRCNKRAYYFSNIITAILSPLLVSVFALVIFVIVCVICGAGFETSDAVISFFEGSIYETWLRNGRENWVLVVKLLAFAAYSLPWGVLCLAISIFSRNKYIIIAFPFILDLALSYFTQTTSLFLLDSGMTLLKGGSLRLPYGGIPYALSYHAISVAAFSLFYYIMSKRRYCYEGI